MAPSMALSKRGNTGEIDEFLAAIAHDLKEPLNNIRCCAELLAKQRGGNDADEANLLVTFISDSAERMQQLIDDAIAFALADKSGAERSQVDMGEVLEFTLRNLYSAIAQTNAIITSGPLPVVTANFGALVRIFQNLIANAITYRSAEPPRIHVDCDGRDGWIFSVADNGIGIEPEYHEYIFQPLKRLHSRRRYPGTGLGLAICKRIVEVYGGRIWLESQPGAGSTFYFTLPLLQDAPPPAMCG